MATFQGTKYDRTVKDAVIRLVSGVGESPPSSTAMPRDTSTQAAIDAVNDALNSIYSRARWEFRQRWATVLLTEAVMYYEMPDDFGELGPNFSVRDGVELMQYIDYEDLVRMVPDLRFWPYPTSPALPVLSSAATFLFGNAGTPEYFSLAYDQLVLWPPPDADWVASNWQVIVPYFSLPDQDLHMDATLIPLPRNLLQAHHFLALSYMKQYLEYPDYQADEARAERYLDIELKRRTKKKRRDLRFKPRA